MKLLFSVVLIGVASAIRTPSCDNALKPLPKDELALYQFGFQGFQSDPRSAADTLNFDALAGLSTASAMGADTAEVLVTVHSIANAVNNATVPIPKVASHWEEVWHARSVSAEVDGNASLAVGNTFGASSSFFRAASYGQVSTRFQNHRTPSAMSAFARTVALFQRALSLTSSSSSSSPTTNCKPVSIPYTDTITPEGGTGKTGHLHGYWCPSLSANPVATLLVISGYDGTAEMLYDSVASGAQHSFNVLLFEGPGQGSTARFGGFPFRPDYEVAVDQVISWVSGQSSVDPAKLVMWGRSFGGYLAPRAFAKATPPIAALVSDGGVYDFYQNGYCLLPESLQGLLGSNASKFDEYLDQAGDYDLGTASFLQFGYLGFNVSTPSDLWKAWQPYNMLSSMADIGSRPVLVHDPRLDTLTNNQSSIFVANLPRPLNPHTTVLDLGLEAGTALHCAVGSSTNELRAILDWLHVVFAGK